MRVGHAGVADTGDVVAAVGGVLHRVVDALIGQKARHHEIFDADIAQQIVEVGGVEEARRGFRDDDLVIGRRDGGDDTRLLRALGNEELRELVVKAAVAAVAREVLDDCVDHFRAVPPERRDKLHEVRDHDVAGGGEEFRVKRRLRVIERGILHVDDEERGPCRIECAIA